jgi:hypothetical protein
VNAARLAGALALLALGTITASARAQGSTPAEARAAYDDAARAYDARDFAHAAKGFAHADALVPNTLVLELALAAATQADDPALAMNIALRAEARGAEGKLQMLAQEARARFEARVGLVRVVCLDGHSCSARIGDQVASGGALIAALPGEVDAWFGEGAAARVVRVRVSRGETGDAAEPRGAIAEAAGSHAETAESAEGATPIAAPRLATHDVTATEPAGLPPAVFWSGVGLSAALGASAIASALDAQSQRHAFLANRTLDTRDTGQGAVLRTNVLVGGTIVSVVATGIIGLFLTRWHAPKNAALAPAVLVF